MPEVAITKTRVHELAKLLKVETRELLKWLNEHQIPVRSASSTVESADVKAAGEEFERRVTRLRGICSCCGRRGVDQANMRIPDGLPTNQSVCIGCVRHQGTDAYDRDKRKRDHASFDVRN